MWQDDADSAKKEQQLQRAVIAAHGTEHQVLDNASKVKAVMECLRHIVIFN
jgi:hypothetical protein